MVVHIASATEGDCFTDPPVLSQRIRPNFSWKIGLKIWRQLSREGATTTTVDALKAIFGILVNYLLHAPKGSEKCLHHWAPCCLRHLHRQRNDLNENNKNTAKRKHSIAIYHQPRVPGARRQRTLPQSEGMGVGQRA